MIAEETPPWQQHVHTTALSEFVVYSISERDKKVGLVPWATATGSDILLSKDILGQTNATMEVYILPRGYCRYIPTHTSTRPLIGIFNDTFSFTPKGANRHGQDTLPLHGENLSLP